MKNHSRSRRINVVGVFVSLLLPWLVGVLTLALLSFDFHYRYPGVCDAAVGVGALVLFVFWVGRFGPDLLLTRCFKIEQVDHGAYTEGRTQGSWFLFVLLTTTAYFVVGAYLGYKSFAENAQLFFDVQNLNSYKLVDTGKVRGQELMDAGAVSFASGSSVDVTKAMSFRNSETFCVAPIVAPGGEPQAQYDFWAVGLNCCSGASAGNEGVNFQCGDVGVGTSSVGAETAPHGGLRVMRADHRPFYRLAVQQAQSTFDIRSAHPLFFYWVNDPGTAAKQYLRLGFKRIYEFMFAVFALQCCLVGLAVVYLPEAAASQLL